MIVITNKKSLSLALAAGLLCGTAVRVSIAGGTGTGDNHFAPNVVSQFQKMKHHGEVLGGHPGVEDQNFEFCNHYESIVRTNGSGTPHMILSRSGKDTGTGCPGDQPGKLITVRMGSRPQTGERLRSNRLARESQTVTTPPPTNDIGVTVIRMDGQGTWPYFTHPGGMQIVDNFLAVPVYDTGANDEASEIWIVDVSNPEAPELTYRLQNLQNRFGWVAMVKRPADGLYYIAAGGVDLNEGFNLYRSTTTTLDDPNMAFQFVYTWHRNQLPDPNNWPKNNCGAGICGVYEFQNVSFVVQPHGQLYLIGLTNGDNLPGSGEDQATLFSVQLGASSISLEYVMRLDVENSWSGAGTNADWGAAGGVYVSPQGNLILYGADYKTYNAGGSQIIRMIEYRNRDLNWAGTAPTGPWIELYADDAATGRSLMLDVADYDLEYWENLGAHDGWGDEADSLIFNAPDGYRIVLFADQNFGGQSMELWGTGVANSNGNLDGQGFGDKVHSVYIGTVLVPERAPTIESGTLMTLLLGGPEPQRRVSISAGDYAETGTIDVPVTLTARGGTVTIGQ